MKLLHTADWHLGKTLKGQNLLDDQKFILDEIFKIIGDEKPITCRPADDIKPELDTLREKVKPWSIQEEDVLTYALFEQVAVKFFEARKAKMYALDENADAKNKIHNV